MFQRQKTGSVVCRTCGRLVGVSDDECYNCGARKPALWGFSPTLRKLGGDLGFVEVVMVACGLLYLGSLVSDLDGVRNLGLFAFLMPSGISLVSFGASGSFPVFEMGRWWTLLSAGWLHGGLLHILFNLYWVRALAPTTAEFYGPGRAVILYTVGSVTGFAFSTLAGALPFSLPLMGGGGQLTVGASAAIFGLLGAQVYYGRRAGSSFMSQQLWGMAALLFVFGLMMDRTDNWAHLGGFVGGYFMGMWLDPLKPEKIDHLAMALICLVASAAAVAASLLMPLRM